MEVSLISNIFNPVGSAAPGGLEVFNYFLANELEKRKIKFNLYASGDSDKMMSLVPIIENSLLYSKDKEFSAVPWNFRRITVEEFVAYTDLIQNLIKKNTVLHFSLVNYLPIYLAVKNKIHSIVTLHMPIENFHYQSILKLLDKDELKYVTFVGISKNQVNSFPVKTEIVHNGVDTDAFPFSRQYRDCFAWIGRIIAEKGCEDALSAAKRANVLMEIAGKPNSATETKFFNEKIKSSFDDKITYRGFVKGEDRENFYRAKALIFPPKWNEAFGLTMIEALSCGTPVIAYNRGAVSEVIVDGVNGFLVRPDDINGLSEGMKRMMAMKEDEYLKMRENARTIAEEKFSLKAMADKYIELYKQIDEKNKV